MSKTPLISKPQKPPREWFDFRSGSKASIRFLISVILMIFILDFSAVSSTFAYMRDANIHDSGDSVGVGWFGGFYLTAEKRFWEESSVGLYYLPFLDVQAANLLFYSVFP